MFRFEFFVCRSDVNNVETYKKRNHRAEELKIRHSQENSR